ncbi:hypothetical protein HOL21_04445 [Candidatus Woesearchaeota archaeon]|jgi:hypothetical protein|nr:hypothetical protein [Candidatus Woesearchaeota archaeon]MBT5397437.1 hypothetical protein [Candidatus Woesearchaeota archaeon]MBT5924528.1 hypothetical protein [Candidatus Woesearchaeota archaeon]MBT7762837.1 hypothetical protein [Candidatus Woesearchaeota archaeon]
MKQLLSKILLGSVLVTPAVACESDTGFGTEQQPQSDVRSQPDVQQPPLEHIITGVTNNNGIVFTGEKEVRVQDQAGSPIVNATVKLVNEPSFNLYLVDTGNSTGGGLFQETVQREGMLMSSLEDRTITIRTDQPVTVFSGGTQAVYDLSVWMADDSTYICNGTYTTEQLIEGRDMTVQLISYFDPTGKVKFVYDRIEDLIDAGILSDLEADKKWYVLTPENPVSPPVVMMREVAQKLFDETTYDRLNSVCPDMTSGEGQPCDDGLFCTKNDMVVNGVCEGTPRTCDDGLPGRHYCDEERKVCVSEPY